MRVWDPLLGPIRLCLGCMEWWPDDDEFFYRAPISSHHTRLCRACLAEGKAEWERTRPPRIRRKAAA